MLVLVVALVVTPGKCLSLVQSSMGSQSWDDVSTASVVVVPVPSSFACNGRVERLKCLTTVVTSDLRAVDWDDRMENVLCHGVLNTWGWETTPLHSAHVGCCVQHHGRVGAAVWIRPPAHGSEVPAFIRGLLPQEVGSVVALLRNDSYRVVSRSRIAMYPIYPIHPFELNFSLGLVGAWNQAMAINKNLGNLIWEYGATRMLNPYTAVLIGENGDTSWIDNPLMVDSVVIATANLFQIREANQSMPASIAGMTRHFANLLSKFQLPTLMLGVGLQAEFENEDAHKTSERLRLDEIHVALLKQFAMVSRSPNVAVRGRMTSSLCERAGVRVCLPLGCPSFTINRSRNLGAVMRESWKNAAQKINDGSIRIALHLPALRAASKNRDAFDEEAYKLLLGLHQRYESFFILQSNYDFGELRGRLSAAGVAFNEERIKFFTDVDKWLGQLQRVDFVIGCRIHGSMAALGAGTAFLLIPTDLREVEMAEAMSLPHIPLGKLGSAKDFDINKTINGIAASFQFEVLETTRRSAIRAYKAMFNNEGVEIHPELEQILESDL